MGSTHKSHRSVRFRQLPQFLQTIHQRILQTSATSPQSHKKGSRMEMDPYRTKGI